MPVQSDHTASVLPAQLPAVTGDSWTTEFVPRLPSNLVSKAAELKAFLQPRGFKSPTDLLRGLLAYALNPFGFRWLGAWGVLTGVADLSHTAWQNALIRSSAWLLWMIGELMVSSSSPVWITQRIRGRVWVVDASMIGQVGKTGDAWRVHMAFDLIAGCVGQVHLSDRYTGEQLRHFHMRAGDLVLLDAGYGYRSTLRSAQAMGAAVLVPFTPRTCPLVDGWGRPLDVVAWLKQAGSAIRSRSAHWTLEGHSGQVRIIAKQRAPHERVAAEQELRRNAQKHTREVGDEALFLCGWMLLMTTLDESAWEPNELLWLYRARWQVELLFKRMKQLLELDTVRATSREGAEALLRARLVAWLLHEPSSQELRGLLPQTAPPPVELGQEPTNTCVVSTWLLTVLTLSTLRQQVHGTWTEARVRECLPRLRRFLVSRTSRPHQETDVRGFLLGNRPRHRVILQLAA